MAAPRVGVGVFVFRKHSDAHFVVGKRKGSLGAGTIALPGGHLEHGESFESCAAREVLEETGLPVEHVAFLTATNSLFEEDGKHYVTIFMTAIVAQSDGGRAAEPMLLEPNKCEGWSWCTLAEMRGLARSGANLFLPLLNLLSGRPNACWDIELGLPPPAVS